MAHLRELLTMGVVSVSFVKADGSIRQMRSTTKRELIEAALPNKPYDETKTRVKNENLFKVLDVDINQFRSFKVDKIIGWSTEFPLPDQVEYKSKPISIPHEGKTNE